MVKLKAPDDNKSGAGFGGEFFPLDDTGHITVPPEAVEDMKAHGFTVVEIDPAPEAGSEGGKKGSKKTADPAPEAGSEG